VVYTKQYVEKRIMSQKRLCHRFPVIDGMIVDIWVENEKDEI